MRKLLWFTVGFFLALLLAVGVMLGTLKTTSAEEVTPSPGSPTVALESTPRPTDEGTPTFLTSLRWQRQRVVSGGCDSLRIDRISQVHYAPCDQGSRLGRFTQDELRTYLVYVARYVPFEGSASGDSTVHLSFVGRGSRQPTEAERTELADWIGTVYDRLTREERRSDLVAHARLLLAQRLGVSPDSIGTLAVEEVAWSDACLEIRHEGMYCAQVHTPGYRIVLRAGDAIYEFRTNMHDLVRQAENPVPTPIQVTPTQEPTQAPTVTPTATPWPTAVPVVITDWRGEYYANASMSGLPLLVRNDRDLDFDWGHGSPAAGLPADFVSARWSRRISFSEGNYRFRLAGDDGVRLWVGGNLLIDRWHDGFTDDTADLYLIGGEQEVVVEYFEMQGVASVRLSWEEMVPIPEDTPTPPDSTLTNATVYNGLSVSSVIPGRYPRRAS